MVPPVPPVRADPSRMTGANWRPANGPANVSVQGLDAPVTVTVPFPHAA
jgi:hypothetical protein